MIAIILGLIVITIGLYISTAKKDKIRPVLKCFASVIITLIGVSMILGGIILMTTDRSNNETAENPPTTQLNDIATYEDNKVMEVLNKVSWIRDLYVSPGHMNIGVLRGEKDWDSPMIGKWACSVLAINGSSLVWVRFVDIGKVAQGKSPNQAEISKFRCDLLLK